MSDEHSETAGPKTDAETPKRIPKFAFALLGISVIAGAWWLSTRAGARRHADAARTSAASLLACVTRVQSHYPALGEALYARFPDDTPFAECAAHADDLAREHGELAKIRLLRDGGAAARLGHAVEIIRRFSLRDPASAFANRDLTPLAGAVADAARAACEIATLESDADLGKCGLFPKAEEPPKPPAARIVNEIRAETPFEALLMDADTRGDHVVVTLAGRERYAEHVQVWLSTSDDRGKSFRTVSLLGPPETPEPLEPPRIVFSKAGTPAYVLIAERSKKGLESGLVVRVGADGLEAHRALPELGSELELIRAGSPLLALVRGDEPLLALVLGSSSSGKTPGKIAYLDAGGKSTQRDTPGLPLAASAEEPPRVIVAERDATTGVASLAAYAVPLPKEPWPKPVRVDVPTLASAAERIAERVCGIGSEKYFPFAVRLDKSTRLVALGRERLFSLPLERAPESELSPSCDRCPPTLLSRSPGGLELALPAGSSVARVPVRTPLGFSVFHAEKTASSGCSDGVYAVAYVVRGRLMSESARTGTWRFSDPLLVAEPNDDGIPVEARIVGLDQRLLLIFRRETPNRDRARIEVVESDDGGSSWH